MFKYLRMWQWNRRWPWNDSMKVIFFSCWSFSVPGVMVLTCSDNCMSHDQWYNIFSDGCTICNGQTRNLLRIAIFNISYIRGLFPEKYFNDKSVPALGELLVIRYFSNFPQSTFSVSEFWNHGMINRDEDQEAYANGCRVTQADWLDGKRHIDSIDLNELLDFEILTIFCDIFSCFWRCLWCIAKEIPENAYVLCVWSNRRPDDWRKCM